MTDHDPRPPTCAPWRHKWTWPYRATFGKMEGMLVKRCLHWREDRGALVTLSRPPTDDELLAWRDEANQDDPYLGPHQMLKGKLATTCDALLSERAAHLATKARLDALTRAAARFTTHEVKAWGGDVPLDHPMHAVNEIIADYVVNDPAALADPEEPHK